MTKRLVFIPPQKHKEGTCSCFIYACRDLIYSADRARPSPGPFFIPGSLPPRVPQLISPTTGYCPQQPSRFLPQSLTTLLLSLFVPSHLPFSQERRIWPHYSTRRRAAGTPPILRAPTFHSGVTLVTLRNNSLTRRILYAYVYGSR